MQVPEQDLIKTKQKARKRPRAFRILVVDGDVDTRILFQEAIALPRKQRIEIDFAANVAEAQRKLNDRPIDLLAISITEQRTGGLKFIADFNKVDTAAQVIVLSNNPSFESSVAAMRAGASDILVKPLAANDISERIDSAIIRHANQSRRINKVQRLRRVCRKLNAARDEVSQQVDVLCNDLVTAYQELAGQVHQVAETSEFAALLRKELDLERLLHQTLEFLLEKAGPTNAAVFLPVTGDEYTLGGYVNYDCADGSPELLLSHLADVVAPAVADEDVVYHIKDNRAMQELIGDDATYLQDCHMLAVPCWAEGEPLAIIALFRDGSQPFHEDVVQTTEAIAPMLGNYLAKIIRVHHRHSPDAEAA